MVYATLVQYFCDIPASDAVTFLGVLISGKIFIYSIALQVSIQEGKEIIEEFYAKATKVLLGFKNSTVLLQIVERLVLTQETYYVTIFYPIILYAECIIVM